MGKFTETDINSLSHSKWRCQYHVVFAPKYRRQIIYGKIKADIGKILRQLCDQKGKELCRYTLSENGEYDKKTAMIFGELLKQGETWIFHAVGQGTNDNSIEALASHFK